MLRIYQGSQAREFDFGLNKSNKIMSYLRETATQKRKKKLKRECDKIL